MSILQNICDQRRQDVAALAKRKPLAGFRAAALSAPAAPSLASAMRGTNADESRVRVIAEHKRSAPSSGPLATPASLETVVTGYQAAGASGLSVLTEARNFGGKLEDLVAARNAVDLPILRKDFTVDAYQLYEAKLNGASAVLLIAAALTLAEAKAFREVAGELGLEVLLELHDASELDYLSIEPDLVGVNNRNLATMAVDLATSEQLFGQLPASGPVRISESGIHSAADAARLLRAGYDGLLIGTQFMQTPDPGAALATFVQDTEALLQQSTFAS